MRIVVCRPQVPFVTGGAELLCDKLVLRLGELGNFVELVAVPFKWYPPSQLLLNAVAWRSLDLSEVNGEVVDLLVATKYPSYAVKHPHKIVWLLHQHRQAYDLLGTQYSDLNNEPDVCGAIKNIDDVCFREAKRVFAQSRTVAERLRKFNGIRSDVLYPPPPDGEIFHQGDRQDFVLVPSALYKLKRVDLFVKAIPDLRKEIQVVVTGDGPEKEAVSQLAKQLGVSSRIKFTGAVSRRELARLYADSLCVYFGPYQEDYGLVTIESFLSGKPVITTTDSGGPTEFVENGRTGFVVEPEAGAISERVNELWEHKHEAAEMGARARQFIDEDPINWDNTLRRLLE
jgi:glycosyltransferase involved in cell wall biosynthesis